MGQSYFPFRQIKQYTASHTASRFDSLQPVLVNRLGYELHYLYPLYQAIGWEDKFKERLGEKRYYDNVSQFLAFAGDYNKAAEYVEKTFDHLSDATVKSIGDEVYNLQNIQAAPAAEMITGAGHSYQVIMINEAHAKPVHRAFTYSLLADLYKAGFRYLAMETLNNFPNGCLDSLNVFTGYYTSEPVAGELVRKALELGYTLVAYDDTTIAQKDPSVRDSIQAQNIFKVLKRDPKARILVHAGYTHICKEPISDYKPMGYWFKKISKIDPFCIDQTGMTEGSDLEYGRLYYDFFTTRFSITEPSVIFQNRKPFNPLYQKGYDFSVVHPPTTQYNNRPSWLTFNGDRKEVLVQPTDKNLFFVQAFYADEYNEDMKNLITPADQTYTSNSTGYYCLFLRKGHYKIVLRDVAYKVLAVKDRAVN
jgi:hypothetical protein